MYQIGDKVSYPMHGAGLIQRIEDREILGEQRSYYIVHIEHGNMDVMVPVVGCEKVGLRPIVKSSVIDAVLKALGGKSKEMDINWNRRNRDNMERLKTGDLVEVAGVIRDLVRVDRAKKLSTGEKKLLSNAKIILASEMSMVLSKTEPEVMQMIEEAI
ncbi:MAG: CarD family transcriptional regulator [Clostridia bacterium]|nr:CarD family transcriptional regulator [Clostridia bacterium]